MCTHTVSDNYVSAEMALYLPKEHLYDRPLFNVCITNCVNDVSDLLCEVFAFKN